MVKLVISEMQLIPNTMVKFVNILFKWVFPSHCTFRKKLSYWKLYEEGFHLKCTAYISTKIETKTEYDQWFISQLEVAS